MTDPAPTLGDVIAHVWQTGCGADIVGGICAELNIDPNTPAANLIALQPGQAVVEVSPWTIAHKGRTFREPNGNVAATIIRRAVGQPA